jgi:transcriptional regulator with XRE-family HTH domain
MSQVQFAKALSMSSGSVAGIEIGKNNVNDRIIKLICFTFNVNIACFRSGIGDMFLKEKNSSVECAIKSFSQLKPVYQDYILKQIDQLLAIQCNENEQEPKKKNNA